MRFLGPSLSLLVLLTAADASAADVVRKVKDIWPGAGSAFFEPEGQGVAVGGHVFFRAVSPETPGALSGPSEVWATDGTEAGTSLLVPRGPSAPGWPTSSAIAGGVAFFTDASGLWKTDGTTAGTSLVHALGNAAGSRLVAGNGRVFFTVGGPGGTNTVWTSDGTAAGTKPLAGGPIATVELVAVGARVVAVGYAPATGTELWASDAALTSLDVIEIAPGSVSSQPRELTAFGGKAYFFTAGGPDAHGGELWGTDGTAAGTTAVKTLRADAPPLTEFAYGLSAGADALYFRARIVGSGDEVWRSDGTQAGTALLKDVMPGANGSTPLYAKAFVAAGPYTYFGANGPAGDELWRTDGTAAGTIALGTGTPPKDLVAVGGRLVFSTVPGGGALWTSNGTLAGTSSLPAAWSSPRALGVVGATVLVTASDATAGRELWAVDLDTTPPAPDAGAPPSSSSGGSSSGSSSGGSSSGSSSGGSSSGSSSSSGGSSGGSTSGGSSGGGADGTDATPADAAPAGDASGCAVHVADAASATTSAAFVLLGLATVAAGRRRGRRVR